MASKDTPKKLYRKQSEFKVISRCRLCNSVVDPRRCKNLFREQNRSILRDADVIHGGELIRDSSLPHLVCSPCERRVKNTIQFKNVIVETQQVLREEVSTKRCVELSPSTQKTAKVRAVGSSRRRSIDFTTAANESLAKDVTPVSIRLSHIVLINVNGYNIRVENRYM